MEDDDLALVKQHLDKELDEMKLNKMIQLGKSSNNTCPNVDQKPNCTETQSTCWAPGTEDVDCPLEDGSGEFGLCCFDGCGNTCLKQCVEVRTKFYSLQAKYFPTITFTYYTLSKVNLTKLLK